MKLAPEGLDVVVGAEVWRYDGGRVLVGGAPTRVLRLSPRAFEFVRDSRVAACDPTSRQLAARLLEAGLAHPDPETLPAVALDQLTVVIPVLGRSAALQRLLSGLQGVRVLVVDDGTPEPAATALHQVVASAGAELLRLDRNVGPASARNAGLGQAETPFVAFVDSDVVVTADALERMLRHFADPELALVGPRVVGTPHPQTWIARYENSRASVDLGIRPALVRPRSAVSWMSSTCLIGRREVLAAGFTAGMRVAEDVDLVWRLCEQGWRVRYEPRVVVEHEHRQRFGPWFRRKLFYGTGAADLAPVHPAAIPPAILRPWTIAVLLCLLAARRWSLPAAAAVSGVAAWRVHRRLSSTTRSRALAVRLVGGGVVAALTQASALALRHWWPIGAVAVLCSRRARWIIGIMALADGLVEYSRLRRGLDPVRFLLARRLDDIAYGTGVWLGCLRRRSFRALVPAIVSDRRAGLPLSGKVHRKAGIDGAQ
ncbi:mycofactocin biosynthesis glycosyltransferase MftF [Microbacterium sp. zg.B48]|uniref:mycofactocin biosynthesis glycosyltransferase MftF n=1 Tax=Microbacterium sp. zg.B48 TaxID=2969408 RepID=UPI00214BC594|nr:mycofactocin biosynthesis glycosyltransferase MftF [Microbacterium sp. zg.B48]MCR2765054.1 mycofactocin biosynthesis glycosyltransferase MftF [Microbacterium sp. zg.B48]